MATEQSVMAVIRAARPSFRSPHDKAAFAVHSGFVAAGYVLHVTGPPAFADDALSSTATDEVGIENWNEVEDNYAFLYSSPDKSSQRVLMKCLVMNHMLFVDVLKGGGSEPLHFEIKVHDYVEENAGTSYASQYKNLGRLVTAFDEEILSKLDGSGTNSSSKPSSSETCLRADRYSPMAETADPDDPYVYPSNPGYVIPPVPGFGGSDLLPGPGAGIYPSRVGFGGESMLVGPHDPRFHGGRVGEPGFLGGQPGVPPGARFDPYGPPGIPGFEPGRFVRNPRRPGGGRHPDLEHFPGGSDYI